jgi:hypothetical protein
MSLAKKMNLKEGMKLRVLGKPANVDLDDVAIGSSAKADAVLVFVKKLSEIDEKLAPMIAAARADRLAWAAYPKAGQLGTDLNRDILHARLAKEGVEGVRLISLDAVWSAMRFRGAER